MKNLESVCNTKLIEPTVTIDSTIFHFFDFDLKHRLYIYFKLKMIDKLTRQKAKALKSPLAYRSSGRKYDKYLTKRGPILNRI